MRVNGHDWLIDDGHEKKKNDRNFHFAVKFSLAWRWWNDGGKDAGMKGVCLCLKKG